MAAFKQDFTITQSDDCSTLSLADISNMGNNDSSYTYSTFTTKNFTIYNDQDDLLATLTIVDSTPVTYSIGKDLYLKIQESLQIGSATPLTVVYKVALSCYVDLQYGQIVASEYNSTSGTPDANTSINREQTLFNIVKAIEAAQIFASIGNGALSQSMLDYANSFTNTFTPTPTS